MAKHKKKHSKKDTVSDDLLGATALSIRKFRKVTNEIARLSTGQKLVGGLALLLGGYLYFDKFQGSSNEPGAKGPRLPARLGLPAAPAPHQADEAVALRPVAPGKSRKSAKSGKATHKPAAGSANA